MRIHNELNPIFSTTEYGSIPVAVKTPIAVVIFFSLVRISFQKSLKCHEETNLQKLFLSCSRHRCNQMSPELARYVSSNLSEFSMSKPTASLIINYALQR